MTTGPEDADAPKSAPDRCNDAPEVPGTAVASRNSGPARGHGHGPGMPFKLPFLEELKRRNVVRVALLYLLVCWLILEPVHVVFNMLEVPVWANRLVLVIMAIGFPAVLIFAWVFEITPEGVRPTSAVDKQASITHRTAQRLNHAIIVVLGLALAYFVADKFWLSRHAATDVHSAAGVASAGTATGGPVAKAAEAHSAISERSIAVLPFLDMSEKKDQEYFSDGLTEELLDLLTQVPDLRVPARTSSFYFKGKQATIAEIGTALGVAHVLEGSVRKAGSTIRVTAQLIRADNGYHLWSKAYDRDIRDIFKVQDEIAAAVVEALKAKLPPAQQAASAHRHVDSEAYNQYLLGRQFLVRLNDEDLRRATQAFRKAIELEPAYAPAWAGLADALYWVTDLETTTGALEAGRREATAAAEKAVALQPSLAYGYLVRGNIRAYIDLNFAGAGDDFRRALALEPESAEVLFDYGTSVLMPTGRLDEAVATIRKATEGDPLNARTWSFLGFALAMQGHGGEARAALDHSMEISPQQAYTPNGIMMSFLVEGRPAEALTASQRSTAEVFRIFGAALAHYDLGHPQAAQQALDELTAKYAYGSAYQIAEVYAWRGDKDRAFSWLERARAQKDTGYAWIKIDPLLRKLKDDPRYAAAVRAAHLR